MRTLLTRLTAVAMAVFMLASPAIASALTAAQQNLLKSGVHYFDIAGTDCSGSNTSGSTTLSGADNTQRTFNYFKGKGLSDLVAAAIVGNFMQESSLNPTVMQKGGNSQNPADADPLGWGIAQWSPGSTVIGIAQKLNINGPIYELATQLDISYAEMTGTAPTGYKNVLGGMQKLSTLSDMVEFFRANFEGGTMGNRQAYAQAALKKYGGSSVGLAGVSGSDAPSGCTAAGGVNCTNPTNSSTAADTTTLSSVRQNVVCLTEAELQKWTDGQMKTGGDFEQYTQGNNEEWCADFASWIYNKAGYPIGSGSNWRVPAVDGIEQIGKDNQRFTYHSSANYTPVPGDMAIHSYSHVNIVVSVNQNNHSIVLVGGNQGGQSDNALSVVNKYTVPSYTGDSITGYVSPKE